MQNKYLCDVGDYGKFGLLRALARAESGKGRLGVVWYLVEGEPSNGDGNHIAYLSAAQEKFFRGCDAELYDALKRFRSARAGITEFERSRLLGKTAFFSDPLVLERISSRSRLEYRHTWHSRALKAVKDCSIVFLDPDNGFEVKSVGKGAFRSPKYVYYDEASEYLKQKNTLVVYQHCDRTGTVRKQIDARRRELRRITDRPAFALHFRRGSARVYFIFPAPGREERIRKVLNQFCGGPWREHFALTAD